MGGVGGHVSKVWLTIIAQIVVTETQGTSAYLCQRGRGKDIAWARVHI